MIKKETLIRVVDNSGAKIARCIGFYGNRKHASIGDIIIVSIQQNYPNATIKRRTIQRALIVRTKYPFQRGMQVFRFNQNAAVILDKKNNPVGNKCSGATVRELKSISSNLLSMMETVY